MKKMATRGKGAKTKGSSFERKIAKILSEWGNVELKRTPQSGGFAKEGNSYRGDINTINNEDFFIFNIECKNQEVWSLDQLFNDGCILFSFFEQCIGDTSDNKVPLLIFTRNHQPIYCLTHKSIYDIMFNRNNIKKIIFDNFVIFKLDELIKLKYKNIEKKLKKYLGE